MTLWQTIKIITLCVAILAPGLSWAEQLYFRVINEAGRQEIKQQITPEEAKRGYSVVSINGTVVKEVAPELTGDELSVYQQEQAALKEAERKRKEQEDYDYALRLRFASMDDLEAEKNRKLRDFDVRISILRNNLKSRQDELGVQQKRAADIERAGREVYDSLTDNIKALEAEIQDTSKSIEQRLEEKNNVAKRYDQDGERLKQLIAPDHAEK
jgi:hypothetical protein